MKPSTIAPVLDAAFMNNDPALLKGKPGVGKTDLVTQSAHRLGYKLIVSHPVVQQAIDYKGMPWVYNQEGEILARWVPYGDMRALIEATEPTIFFLDDLGQAPDDVQAAVMQLLLKREIDGCKISDQICFAAATNRRQDRAGVRGILEPVKGRFRFILEVEVDADDWVRWGLTNQMPPILLAYIRMNPGMLEKGEPTPDIVNTANPRTVSSVGKIIIASNAYPQESLYELIEGAAGNEFAADFYPWLANATKLPNIDAIINAPAQAPVPDDDPSVLLLICTALAARASLVNFDNVAAYAKRLPMEFSTRMMTDIAVTKQELTQTRAFIDWEVNQGNGTFSQN